MEQITIVGGDFNIDERFSGKYKGWRLLAKKMKKELFQLGHIEVLSDKFGVLAWNISDEE